MMRWVCLWLLLLLAFATPAFADVKPEPEPARPTEFGAAAPTVKLEQVKPGDFEGMLRNCDILRTQAETARANAEKDGANMPFLVAAYLALWLILLVYFVLLSRRQAHLRAEMLVLRERLARLGDGAP